MAACASSAVTEAPFELRGSTAGAADRFAPTCGAQAGGRDVAFQFTAPAAGRYEISTVGSRFDTVVSVRRGCDGAEVVCNDDARPGRETGSTVLVELAACETVIVVVDGFSSAQMGDFVMRISARESACDNGSDDDGDGAIDCDDIDCFSPSCSGGGDWPAAWEAFEWRVLELTNERRAAGAVCGGERFGPAPPLEMNPTIRIAARAHSVDMGRNGYFEHDSLDGRTFADRMRMAGFSGAQPWGENIAAGQSSPEEVVQGWMDSPGHCRNIMTPEFRTIGIGYAEVEGSPYGRYWTQDFAASH